MLQNRGMSLDEYKARKCSSRMYHLHYYDAAVNGSESNIFLLHAFLLERYIMVRYENMSLTLKLLSLDSLFAQKRVKRRKGLKGSTIYAQQVM